MQARAGLCRTNEATRDGEGRRNFPLTVLNSSSLLVVLYKGERSMLRCLLWALAAAVQPKALLIAGNLCPRQQLVVLRAASHGCALRMWTDVSGFGVSLVQRLANLSPRCKARNGAPRLVHVVAPAFTPYTTARLPPNSAGTADPHPPDDRGEPTYMSTPHVKPPTPFLSFFLSLSFV
jgi:hypothetical protein